MLNNLIVQNFVTLVSLLHSVSGLRYRNKMFEKVFPRGLKNTFTSKSKKEMEKLNDYDIRKILGTMIVI